MVNRDHNLLAVDTYKTKLKLDKEVGGGGGISERSREPNDKTGGTGERPESTSGPRGASATDRGGISERTRERVAGERVRMSVDCSGFRRVRLGTPGSG